MVLQLITFCSNAQLEYVVVTLRHFEILTCEIHRLEEDAAFLYDFSTVVDFHCKESSNHIDHMLAFSDPFCPCAFPCDSLDHLFQNSACYKCHR